jgi:hypothetical protein
MVKWFVPGSGRFFVSLVQETKFGGRAAVFPMIVA